MILNGIVILNRNSAADSLREYCLHKSTKDFPALGGYETQMGFYLIWDNFDELTRAHENRTADFSMQYYLFIKNTFDFYSRHICSPVPNYHHLYKWLSDETYRTRYKLPPYRDPAFMDLITGAFSNLDMDVMFMQAGKIKNYVLNKSGGFDVDNFILKGPCGG
jgi:hypothetical protein